MVPNNPSGVRLLLLPCHACCNVQVQEWTRVAALMASEVLFVMSWPKWQAAMQAKEVEAAAFTFETNSLDKAPLLRDIETEFRVLWLTCYGSDRRDVSSHPCYSPAKTSTCNLAGDLDNG